MDLTDIFRPFHPKFVKIQQGTFSRIDHILAHNKKPQQTEDQNHTMHISDPNPMKLEIKDKKKSGKTINTWKLNNMLLNNESVKWEIKEEIKKYMKQMKMKTQSSKTSGMQQKQFLEGSL